MSKHPKLKHTELRYTEETISFGQKVLGLPDGIREPLVALALEKYDDYIEYVNHMHLITTKINKSNINTFIKFYAPRFLDGILHHQQQYTDAYCIQRLGAGEHIYPYRWTIFTLFCSQTNKLKIRIWRMLGDRTCHIMDGGS